MSNNPFPWRTESNEQYQERLRRNRIIDGNNGPCPEAAALARQRAQRLAELPDSLFDQDPEVQRLRQELHIRTAVCKGRGTHLNWLEGQRQRLRDEIAQQQAVVTFATFADVVAQDNAFTRTAEAMATIERCRRLLEATAEAMSWLQDSPEVSNRPSLAKEATNTALKARLSTLRDERLAQQADPV